MPNLGGSGNIQPMGFGAQAKATAPQAQISKAVSFGEDRPDHQRSVIVTSEFKNAPILAEAQPFLYSDFKKRCESTKQDTFSPD